MVITIKRLRKEGGPMCNEKSRKESKAAGEAARKVQQGCYAIIEQAYQLARARKNEYELKFHLATPGGA